jgi:hypothetical protein
MAGCMLSVHSVEDDERVPPTAEAMQHNWQQLQLVEAEMKSTGAWVFSGACTMRTLPRWYAWPTARS